MTVFLLMLTMSTVLGFGNSRRPARQADDDCAQDNTLTYSMTLAGDGKGNSAKQLNNPRGENPRLTSTRNATYTGHCHYLAPSDPTYAHENIQHVTESSFPSPPATGVAVDNSEDGHVYVCDRDNNRIQVFDKKGKAIAVDTVLSCTRACHSGN